MGKEQTQRIIDRLREGDSSVLESVYLEHRKPFLRYCSRFNLSRDDLLDIYQDSILAFTDNVVYGSLDSLESSMRTYIISIGKFMIYKRLKHLEKIDMAPLDVERLDRFLYEIEEENDFNEEEMELFKKRFEQLGKQCKELLHMFYYRGLKLEEIQERMGYDSYNVVKSQKSRCLKHLKTLINDTKHGL